MNTSSTRMHFTYPDVQKPHVKRNLSASSFSRVIFKNVAHFVFTEWFDLKEGFLLETKQKLAIQCARFFLSQSVNSV